jgi:hypothetical protein
MVRWLEIKARAVRDNLARLHRDPAGNGWRGIVAASFGVISPVSEVFH